MKRKYLFFSDTLPYKTLFILSEFSEFYPCDDSSSDSLKECFILTRFSHWRIKKNSISLSLIITSSPYEVFYMTADRHEWYREIYLKTVDILSHESELEIICFQHFYFFFESDSYYVNFFFLLYSLLEKSYEYFKFIFWTIYITPHSWFFFDSF